MKRVDGEIGFAVSAYADIKAGFVTPDSVGLDGLFRLSVRKDAMKEILPPTWEDKGYKPSSSICPSCGKSMVAGSLPCPDRKPGCLVLHYGFTCTGCGKQFTN